MKWQHWPHFHCEGEGLLWEMKESRQEVVLHIPVAPIDVPNNVAPRMLKESTGTTLTTPQGR